MTVSGGSAATQMRGSDSCCSSMLNHCSSAPPSTLQTLPHTIAPASQPIYLKQLSAFS